MQKCLNKEHIHNVNCLKETPLYWLLIVVSIIAPIIFITLGYYCAVQWICLNNAASILIGMGLSMIATIAIFCIIPYVIGISLNMCYTYDWSRHDILPRTVKKIKKVKKPLTSKRIPPTEPPPKDAFVSYDEFTHANPLKSQRSQKIDI
jgi:hypothetical protein